MGIAIFPLAIFIKFDLGEVVPGPHLHAKFHRSGLKNVGLRPQKVRKVEIFGINLPLRQNPGGLYKNLNIIAQLRTFPYRTTP